MFNSMSNQINDSNEDFIKILFELFQQEEWIASPLKTQDKPLNVSDMVQMLYVIIKDEFCAEVKLLHKNTISIQLDSGETFFINIEKPYFLDIPSI